MECRLENNYFMQVFFALFEIIHLIKSDAKYIGNVGYVYIYIYQTKKQLQNMLEISEISDKIFIKYNHKYLKNKAKIFIKRIRQNPS